MLLAEAGCVFMVFILLISGTRGQKMSICALKGSSVDLFCSARDTTSKNKWYTVHWDGSNFIQTDLSTEENRVTYMSEENQPALTIKDLRETDAKSYCCRENANRPDLCSVYSVQLHVAGLTVKFTPSAEVTEGQRVTLTCSTSCPLPDHTNYIWYLNSRPLILTENQHKHLVLDPVSSQHAGNYSCAIKTGTEDMISSEKSLTVHSATGMWTGVAVAVLLVIILLAVFWWIRKKKSSSQSTRTETSDNMEQESPVSMYENVSARSTEQDDDQYYRLHFTTQNRTDDLYSTIQTASPN